MDKGSLFLLIFYFGLIAWPVSFAVTTNPDIITDQRIVNALITASGIIFGLITAITVTRREKPPSVFFAMVVDDFGLLAFAGNELFMVALGRGSLLSALSWTMASFLCSHFTALSLLILY